MVNQRTKEKFENTVKYKPGWLVKERQTGANEDELTTAEKKTWTKYTGG